MEDEKNEKGFVIKDRRLFDETGEVRGDTAQEDTRKQDPEKPAAAAQKQPEPAASEREMDQDDYLPEVNFANFVLSLSTTVLYHFGDFPDPATSRPVRNLKAAKHAIDTLGMLKSKTQGNLTEDEKNLLEGVLFELRMRFVKESQTP